MWISIYNVWIYKGYCVDKLWISRLSCYKYVTLYDGRIIVELCVLLYCVVDVINM